MFSREPICRGLPLSQLSQNCHRVKIVQLQKKLREKLQKKPGESKLSHHHEPRRIESKLSLSQNCHISNWVKIVTESKLSNCRRNQVSRNCHITTRLGASSQNCHWVKIVTSATESKFSLSQNSHWVEIVTLSKKFPWSKNDTLCSRSLSPVG